MLFVQNLVVSEAFASVDSPCSFALVQVFQDFKKVYVDKVAPGIIIT